MFVRNTGSLSMTYLLCLLVYRKVGLDAFSLAGTKQAFEVLRENFDKLPQQEISRVFLGLPFAQQPSADHADDVWVK